MALYFDASTEKVNCGAGAVLDNLYNGSTACYWFRIGSIPTDGRMAFKGLSATNNYRSWGNILSSSGGQLQVYVKRSTQDWMTHAVLANFSAYALNKWLFVAARMNINDMAQCGVLMGSLTEPAQQPSAYSVWNLGSGALTSDAGAPLILMNKINDGAGHTAGTLAWVGLWKRILTHQEILEQQRNPRVTSGCIGFWRLGGTNGTAIQRDLSGYGNHGTVTGATLSLDPPLPVQQPLRRVFYIPVGFLAGWAAYSNSQIGAV